jgi:hypothetical protein
MATERVTERTDGVTAERTTEYSAPTTTVVEKRGGGSGILWGLVALALVALVGYFLLNMNRQGEARTEAVSGAASSVADSVEGAAEGVAGAADRAADSVNPN